MYCRGVILDSSTLVAVLIEHNKLNADPENEIWTGIEYDNSICI